MPDSSTRERILDAAEALFARSGNKGSLYVGGSPTANLAIEGPVSLISGPCVASQPMS